MIRKANYKPTLPIFGEGFLGVQAKSVRFEDKSDPLQQQYDSLYDDHMKDYFNRPKIKKRLVQLRVTDSAGNPLTNKEQERDVMKKKQLLKEREEIVKKIRIREADRIARLASASNKVSKSCVACETHNRILSYLRNHMCPIHSNVTYQRAKETLKDAVSHDVSSNEDNLAKLETENKTLKNLWYSEVLRMEEEALQQQLKNEKRRLQQVLFELKKLKQQKEAIDMESLEEIKINLYSKIKRRLGLQALLTTLREVEDGVTAAMYDKVGQDVDVDSDMDDWSLPPQLNRVGLSFQYLPPPTPPQTPVVSNGYQQYVRPSSAPVGSQQVMNSSELSLHQPSFQYDEQLKKRPSSSRGYRADNRGPYSRGTISAQKQTANISPLVNSTSALPQQFSNMVKSNSSLVNGPLVNKEDVDDDTMPLDEAETALEGLSDIEMSSLPSSTSDEPITLRDKIQRHRQGEYSVMSESALNPRPPIPAQRSIPTNLSKIKQSSEKKVNFIDPVPTSSSEKKVNPAPSSQASGIGSTLTKNTKEQSESTTEQLGSTTETTHDEATNGERNLKDARSAEIADDGNKNNADITEECNLNSVSDLRKTPYEKNDKTVDYQSTPSLAHTTSNDSTKTTPKEMEDHDPIVNKQLFDETVTPSQTESPSTTYAEGSTPKIIVEDMDSITEQVLLDAAAANKPLAISKNRSFIRLGKSSEKVAQGKNLKSSSSKKINANKSSKQLVKSASSRKLNAKNSKQFESKTSSSKPKQGVKQTSKKPNKVNQDWKKTILQTMKK